MFKGDQGHLHTTVAVLCWNHRGNAPEMCKRLGPEKRRRWVVRWWGVSYPCVDLMARLDAVLKWHVAKICCCCCCCDMWRDVSLFHSTFGKKWLIIFDGCILCIFSALCFFAPSWSFIIGEPPWILPPELVGCTWRLIHMMFSMRTWQRMISMHPVGNG